MRWRCQDRKCKGALHIENDILIKEKVEHSHMGSVEKCKALKIKREIKQKAITTKERSVNIIISEFANIDNDVILHLPNFNSIRDGVTRARNKIIGLFLKI